PATAKDDRRGDGIGEHNIDIRIFIHEFTLDSRRHDWIFEPMDALLHRFNAKLAGQIDGMLRDHHLKTIFRAGRIRVLAAEVQESPQAVVGIDFCIKRKQPLWRQRFVAHMQRKRFAGGRGEDPLAW
ncbi:MAG: hypothetical protein ACK56I_14140, partial [bacterium]